MIVVTGGAGFIGSNIVSGLNERGRDDILVVDDLSDGRKFRNIASCNIHAYMDKEDFWQRINSDIGFGDPIDVVFHQGACSVTTEWNGRYMMRVNYDFSCCLLRFCLERGIPFIYASSAAVYGKERAFSESPGCERPITVYGYSKLLFDQYVRRVISKSGSKVIGLRYFNVYGPNEQHKGDMASVAFHFRNQLLNSDKVLLFEGSDGFGAGEQRRDFVYVDDVIRVNFWCWEQCERSGIFNLGTGFSQSFNDVANAIRKYLGRGVVEYIPFPSHLVEHYQSFTEADISALRGVGYKGVFRRVEDGVLEYMRQLDR